MLELVSEYYPNPAMYTYVYLASQLGDADFAVPKIDIDKQHLEDLEVSGFIKVDGDKIILKENGEFLFKPPKIKQKVNKEPYVDKRVEQLADIVGYPIDWHKRGKYEKLFRVLTKQFEWSIIREVAEYWKDNKKDEELVLNYFLTVDCFKSIKNFKENPKKEKTTKIETTFRAKPVNTDFDECPF